MWCKIYWVNLRQEIIAQMLEFKNVSVRLGADKVSSPFSLIVESGEIVCLQGAHGSGKTRILSAVLGLGPLAAGFITLDGELISLGSAPYFRRMMAYVPQNLPGDNITLTEICHDLGLNINNLTDVDATLKDKKLKTLSAEETQTLLLQVALQLNRRILLIDNIFFSPVVASLLRKHAEKGTEIIYTCVENRFEYNKVINL